MSSDEREREYRVPALEKGLDILEELAAAGVPMTQAQLARALGRGASELFRMLACLEQRGYLVRDPASGAYGLTLRLYELSRAHSPFEGLLRAAERPMRELAASIRESCHIGVLQRDQLLVLAQAESPARLRLSVEVGAGYPLLGTASGRLLLAYTEPGERAALLDRLPEHARLGEEGRAALREQLAAIAERGYEVAYGESTDGVTDMVVLIGRPGSVIRAALAVPSLTRERGSLVERTLPALRHHADLIARAAGIIA